MNWIILSTSCFIGVLLLYLIVGKWFEDSQIARNLDLSLFGLVKAIAITVLVVGVSNIVGTLTGGMQSFDISDQVAEVESIGAGVSGVESTDDTIMSDSAVSLYQDGTFYGTGRGFKGDITVSVQVQNGLITNVEVLEHRDDLKWFNMANSRVPQRIIDAQSAEVDVVSGATYSSEGIIGGVKNALSESRGDQ